MSDHYRTLGLQPNANKRDIKNAYFRLAQRYHPDHHAKADAAGRAAAAVWFRRAKNAYEVLYDDRRRTEYDRTIRSSASGGGYGNWQHGQYGSGSGSSANEKQQCGPSGGDSSRSSGGGTAYSKESNSDWIFERTRSRGHGGGAYSSSSGNGNQQEQHDAGASSRSSGGGTWGHGDSAYSSSGGNLQGQYGGTSSKSSEGDTSSSTESSDPEWIWERAQMRGHGGGASSTASGYAHGGTSSSTASRHKGGSGSRPPPRVPRPMAALFVCCAGVLGGSALLWSMYNKPSAPKQQES